MSSDNLDTIDKLYKNSMILADAKDKSAHTKEYLEILTAVKGGAKEKKLASQFIARFFKEFPLYATSSMDAMLDLCEDEDISIRKQAIKDLAVLCRGQKEHVQKIADILAQLFQGDDAAELMCLQKSLQMLLETDAKATLAGVFSQILSGEDPVRERCIKFVHQKVKGSDLVSSKEIEDYLVVQCKKVLQDVTAEEFHLVMEVLGATRLGQTPAGQQQLVDLVAEQAEVGQDFDPCDAEGENVERLLQCVRIALPYFSAEVASARFVAYMCDQVIPQLASIQPGPSGGDPQLELLKLFAELCTHCGPLESVEQRVQNVFEKLVGYMPLPPPDVEGLPQEEPRLEFSYVECLMYAFHQLGRQCPDFLTKDAERLKDFRFRLQYFARGIQGYIKKLREALQGKSGEELKSEENRIKVVALKTTSNINTLIKDLFHSPPSFKSSVSLSWKPAAATSKEGSATAAAGWKRHTPITFGSGESHNKLPRGDRVSQRELYQPPSGKYSNKVSSYVPPRGRGGRSRSRGGFRGGRGWRHNY